MGTNVEGVGCDGGTVTSSGYMTNEDGEEEPGSRPPWSKAGKTGEVSRVTHPLACNMTCGERR